MTDRFVKTGVIGHPISHSKSPLIHRYWIEKYGLSGSYEAIDITPQTLKQGVQDLIDQGYSGFNVTVPHKVAMMELCDDISESAQAIGAVNTISLQDGKIFGNNSDGFGFIENLKAHAPKSWSFEGKAVVFGAGGAALAIVHALLEEGVSEVLILNRTREKADALCSKFGRKPVSSDWLDRNTLIQDANLIVNTTSLGMTGQPPLEIDLKDVQAKCLVNDIVYAPLMTDLLLQAQKCNLPVVTGIGMLLHQARLGFELWHGTLPDVTKDLEDLAL